MEQCVDAVGKWMAASRLKMNSDKSEIIWVGTKHTVSVHPLPPIQIGRDTIGRMKTATGAGRRAWSLAQ